MNTRDLGLNGAGKGDAERSFRWRVNYDEVKWTGVQGFSRVGRNRLRKVYGKQIDQPAFPGDC